MFYIFLVLSYASLLESHKIIGHAEFREKGGKMIHFLTETSKDILWNSDNIRKLWDVIKSGEVEIESKPINNEDSNQLTKPKTNSLERGSKKAPLSSDYPANYPELSAFEMRLLIGEDDDKRRFLELIKDIAPVYRKLISSLNAEYLQKHGQQYPISMLAKDFVQLAEHFKVRIKSNGGKTYNVNWSL